ncbi:hypothetical protein NDU88_004868, partial [Pleurodeles waltl]
GITASHLYTAAAPGYHCFSPLHPCCIRASLLLTFTPLLHQGITASHLYTAAAPGYQCFSPLHPCCT